MKLLVIGGSYFYGRVFVMLAAAEKHDITVVNRGTYSMEEFGVRQVRGDRRQGRTFAQCTGDYDVVIDFCAYNPGDAAFVLEHLPGQIKQYLLISTVDVYRRGTGAVKDEDFPLETRSFPGEAGAYILGKAALEEELCRECRRREIPFTILRPAILYGPYNYAPREYLFIRMAVQNRVLPGYTDAEGRFQLVYVKDAARAALLCLLEEKAYGQAFNLCQEEILDYDLFFQGIRQAADLELGRAVMTLAEAQAAEFPIPFPAAAEETELVDNRKSREVLGVEYTAFSEGIGKTWRAFRNLFSEE